MLAKSDDTSPATRDVTDLMLPSLFGRGLETSLDSLARRGRSNAASESAVGTGGSMRVVFRSKSC
jgi:hypothetical protein